MINYVDLTEAQASMLSNQLWKYFDIEGDVQCTATQYNNGTYRIFYWTESGLNNSYVSFKMFDHSDSIEDLYLVDVDGKLIGPTTTEQQQMER